MKISENWLRQWVNPAIETKVLAEQLTMVGLEVDSVNPVAPEFTGVVVGEVLDRVQHPNADKLSVCKVNVGGPEILTIVCGAKNVRQGLKVPVATIGAILPGNFKIQAAELRGEPSQGMICSEKELGLESLSEGIMEWPSDAPSGKDFREYFNLNDNIIEIELTPNRGDCLSIRGVAREVATIHHLSVNSPEIKTTTTVESLNKFPVKIIAGDRCPKYCGRVIRDISARAVAPLWMQENLRRSGIRSINPVVDVCNYVMLELGQPMHGFDVDKLKGEIIVRLAKPGEQITLLNEENLTLNASTLVIADAEKPHAIAGVMGGLESSVGETTKNIFLESAYFNPVGVRRDSKAYHLSSDSAYRFERGVDFNLQRLALERATELLLEIVGGHPEPIIEVEDKKSLPIPKIIQLRRPQIQRILGLIIQDEEVAKIFAALEFEYEPRDFGWEVKVPSHRFDLEIEVDLIEELARIFGYDNIPATRAKPSLTPFEQSEIQIQKERVEHYFLDRGYDEVITYSFVDPALQTLIDPDAISPPLMNPLSSDMSVMRTSLWPGLLKTWQYNLNRQANRLRIFEMGLIFNKTGGSWNQNARLGFLSAGRIYAEQWGAASKTSDFYDLKNDLMGLFSLLKSPTTIEFKPGTHHALHPGQSADICYQGKIVGHMGALHPKIQEALDLTEAPWLCEIDLDVVTAAVLPKFLGVSKFPGVRRDLAFVVEKDLPAAKILESVRQSGGEWLQDVQLFDVYQGEHIESGKKSIAIGLTFVHPSRTLIEQEINEIIQIVLRTLEQSFNATLRA
jgi:phenylalanyl-tRNA synthetase beta chain